MESSDIIELGVNVGGARQIARKLIQDSEIKERPVSLWKIIKYLQTQYELQMLRFPFTDSISGILVMEGDCMTIGFNENHPWCRRRFSIAHEIGHLLMGHLCKGEDKGSPAEIEAYKFAAELLMPAEFFKKELELDLDVLSKKYQVSKEALCKRFIDCRML
ncbi:MAG: ImmA/IrrE family metallo-endopeptidase [Parcubacteria group bacterium]